MQRRKAGLAVVIVRFDEADDSQEADVADSCDLLEHCVNGSLPALVCEPIHERQGHHDAQK